MEEKHLAFLNLSNLAPIASYGHSINKWHFKGPLSSLRQFLRTESSLKMMKNAFYFMLKALFILEIFTFLS